MPSNKSMKPLRLAGWIMLAASVFALAGCVTTGAPAYQPSVSNTETLMKQSKTPLGVAKFNATPGFDDGKLFIRGSTLTGGADGKFSTYLHDATISELKTAGRFDPNAKLQISGTLEHNSIDGAAIKTASAEIAAHFVITRDGQKVYDKSVSVRHEWESSFIGGIAIPAAIQNYASTVQLLLGKFFADPDFISATRSAESSN